MAGDAKKLIDFGDFISGEEALQIAARALRSLKTDVNTLSKTVADDSGRIAAGFATIKQGIADIQGKAGKLQLFSGEDKAILAALAQQLGELKKRQEDYKATQAAQATIQRGLTDSVKVYNSELAKQKQLLVEAQKAGDVEAQKRAAAAIRQTTQETKDFSAALRGANSGLTAAKGSYNELVIENNKLLASLQALDGGLAGNNVEAKKLQEQIFANTQVLKEFDAATNRNFREVGNYAKGFSGLVAELAKARAAQAGLTQGSEDYNRAQIRITGFQTAAQKSAAQMGLSYEQAEAKINGVIGAVQPLTTALVRLEKEQEQVAISAGKESEAYQRIGFQIQQTKKEIDDIAASTVNVDVANHGLEQQLGFTRQALEEYLTQLAIGAIGLQALAQAAVSVFQANVEYSRNLAEVRKTTGLTADEADRLGESLKELNTTTSLAGLLKIASVGGQLGIAKGDLLDFTKAIDTAVQALGNDFSGGAEEIATTLGKISSVFRKELGGDAAQNILAVGSAVNQLGADGAATAPFLTDVALRVGAVAAQSGVGLKNVLAYAAVLQETGFQAETSGTALNRFFSTLSTRTKESFDIAKNANPALTLKEFTRLVNTDFNAAAQLFLKGLNAGGKTTTALNKELATLKLQSGEAKNAIITLAQNTDLFAERQKSANDQLRDATSLAAEASINTETLAGSYEKLKNNISSFFTTGAVASFFKGLIDFAKDGIFYQEQLKQTLEQTVEKTAATGLAARALASGVQDLFASYQQLEGTTGRTAAQQQQLNSVILKLKDRLGDSVVSIDKQTGAYTLNTAAVQAAIQKQYELSDAQTITLAKQLKGLNDQREQARQTEAALSQSADTRAKQLTDIASPEQLAKIQRYLTLVREGSYLAKAGLPVQVTKEQVEMVKALQAETERLGEAGTNLEKIDSNRAIILAKLKELGFSESQALALLTESTKKQTEADKEGAQAAEKLGRTQVERTKNRLQSLKDSLEDNQLAIDLAKKYQEEQGKLFEAGQIEREAYKENVAGSQDFITQRERDGTALRIAIAKAEATEKLAEAQKDRQRQLAEKNITENEKTDIEGQFSEKRVGIVKARDREIEKINREASERQGKIDPLEFKVVEPVNRTLPKLSYETRLQSIKDGEAASNLLFEQAYANGTISRRKYEKELLESRKRANEEELKLDKEFGKNLTEQQREQVAIQKAIQQQKEEERRRVVAKTVEEVTGVSTAYYNFQAAQLSAQLDNENATYENSLKAAGDNTKAKQQIETDHAKKLAEIKKKQAENDRKQALFNILISTAQAIAGEIREFGFLAGLPFIIADTAVGALQAAAVLKAAPGYFKGRRSGPKELALTGERGPELIERVNERGPAGGSRWDYVTKPTYTVLQKGDNVYTADESRQMLNTSDFASLGLQYTKAQQPMQTVVQAFSGAAAGAAQAREAAAHGHGEELLAAMQQNTAHLKKLEQVTVTVHQGSSASVQRASQLTHYLNQATFGRLGN